MTILAASVFEPATVAIWLVIGLVSGWLAGKMMENASYGAAGDLILGCVGALLGACLFAFIWQGYWGSMLVAFVGAGILIGAGRAIAAYRDA